MNAKEPLRQYTCRQRLFRGFSAADALYPILTRIDACNLFSMFVRTLLSSGHKNAGALVFLINRVRVRVPVWHLHP